MPSRSQIEVLHRRIATLEQAQRQWRRMAIGMAATGILMLAGWAPLDALPSPGSSGPKPAASGTGGPPTASSPLPTGGSTGTAWESIGDVPAVRSRPVARTTEPAEPKLLPPEDALGKPAGKGDSAAKSGRYNGREGDAPFVPSRLDWLSLRANSTLPRGSVHDGYGILYRSGGPNSNTILITAYYDPESANRDKMQIEITHARKQIEAIASTLGWQWLKIREQSESQ